jgi:acetate kinase
LSRVLVVNAGSTSLKLRLVDDAESVTQVDALEAVAAPDLAAVGHRVVHGGAVFHEPVLIDDRVRHEIEALQVIAPLHNAPALAGIEAAGRALPGVPQLACFDTAFHATIPDAAATYAVPRRWREEWGVRRYGFHGLSVAWSVERAGEMLGRPLDALRLVVCHLGGGCSVTAVRGGRSMDTTMGFSPLEGVPMSTRSGSVDPGALVFLLREKGLTVEALDHALNSESGLTALAGVTGKELVEAASGGDPDAALALEVFAHRTAGAVAAMAVAAGGLDCVVFTGGIGEGSPALRELICGRLELLNVRLDAGRNSWPAEGDRDISATDAPVRVLVVVAREELVIARAVRSVLAGRA